MPNSLLEALERLAAVKGLPDPNIILAIDSDKRRVQRKRSKPWWLRDIISEGFTNGDA